MVHPHAPKIKLATIFRTVKGPHPPVSECYILKKSQPNDISNKRVAPWIPTHHTQKIDVFFNHWTSTLASPLVLGHRRTCFHPSLGCLHTLRKQQGMFFDRPRVAFSIARVHVLLQRVPCTLHAPRVDALLRAIHNLPRRWQQ